MSKLFKTMPFTLAAITVLLAGCMGTASGPVAPISESELRPAKQAASSAAAAPAGAAVVAAPDQQKAAAQQPPTPAAPAGNRIEVAYFIAVQRCTACECVQERLDNVINKSFSDAVSQGKLIYTVLKLQDEGSKATVKKYRATGSQLFINLVMNGVENIVEVLDVWDWDCRGKPAEFEQKLKSEIERYLTGVS